MIHETYKNKLNEPHNYYVIDELPSKCRDYKLKKILVRDLMFDEVKILSKYLEKEYNLRQLLQIYTDIIKIIDSNDKEFAIENLELVDFHYLTVASTVLTDSSTSWQIENSCQACNARIKKSVNLAEIDYNVPSFISNVPLAGTKKIISCLKIKDLLLLEDSDKLKNKYLSNFVNLDNESFKDLLSYALSLKYNKEDELIDNINFLYKSPKYIKLVKQINLELKTEILPTILNCGCGFSNEVLFQYESLRGYL